MTSSSAAANTSTTSNDIPKQEPFNGAVDKEMNIAHDAEASSLEEEPKVTEPTQAKPPADDCGCGDDADSKTSAHVNNDIPSTSDLERAYALYVYDAPGNKHSFKSIVQREGIDKHLVIFIRHFFCGLCQQYLAYLNELLPPSSLPQGTKITIISNGHHSYINTYKQITQCPYDIYVDPDESPLYAALKMHHTLNMGAKPNYVKSSFLSLVRMGVGQGLRAGKNAMRGGSSSQVGGEFLFVRSSSGSSDAVNAWRCTWAHRMKTTRGHAEVEELRNILLSGNGNGKVNGTANHSNGPPVKNGSTSAAAVATATRNPRLDSIKSESRLSRRMSARISGLWKRQDGISGGNGTQQNGTISNGNGNGNGIVNGHARSEKANGKAPMPADPAAAAFADVTANGNHDDTAAKASASLPSAAQPLTIRPVNGSPLLT